MKDQIPGDNSSSGDNITAAVTAITDVMKVTATFCVWPLCNRSGKKKKKIFSFVISLNVESTFILP